MSSDSLLRQQIDLYPAIIFDMDGTLMNSEIWHHRSWNDALKQYGIPELSTDKLYAYGGMPSLEIAKDVLKNVGNTELDPQEVGDLKGKLYRQEYMMQAEPFPLVCSFLKELHAEGKRIAIATSSHQQEARFLLGKHGLLDYIDAVISGDMVTRGKPNPDIYLLAAEKLNAKIEDCLVFEDTVIGMQGIKNAGMAAVKVFEGEYACDHVITKDEVWTGTK